MGMQWVFVSRLARWWLGNTTVSTRFWRIYVAKEASSSPIKSEVVHRHALLLILSRLWAGLLKCFTFCKTKSVCRIQPSGVRTRKKPLAAEADRCLLFLGAGVVDRGGCWVCLFLDFLFWITKMFMIRKRHLVNHHSLKFNRKAMMFANTKQEHNRQFLFWYHCMFLAGPSLVGHISDEWYRRDVESSVCRFWSMLLIMYRNPSNIRKYHRWNLRRQSRAQLRDIETLHLVCFIMSGCS